LGFDTCKLHSSYSFLHLKLQFRPLESCENVRKLSRHFQGRSLLPVHIVTVIVIQSRQVGDDFHMSEISPAQASIALRESSTSVPTSEEKVLFDRLEKWCGKHLQDPEAIGEALHALSVSSIRWKDFKRWDNSMRVSSVQKNTRLLPFRIFVKACEEFGFPLMKPL